MTIQTPRYTHEAPRAQEQSWRLEDELARRGASARLYIETESGGARYVGTLFSAGEQHDVVVEDGVMSVAGEVLMSVGDDLTEVIVTPAGDRVLGTLDARRAPHTRYLVESMLSVAFAGQPRPDLSGLAALGDAQLRALAATVMVLATDAAVHVESLDAEPSRSSMAGERRRERVAARYVELRGLVEQEITRLVGRAS